MRSYRISVGKVPETRGQNAPIFKRNPAFGVNAGDGYDFTVCSAKVFLVPVCSKQQPVAGSDLDGTPFVDLERLRLFGCESPFPAVGITDHHAFVRNPNHFQRFVLRNAFDGAVESKHLTGGEIP